MKTPVNLVFTGVFRYNRDREELWRLLMYFDTHAHYDDAKFDADRETLLAIAFFGRKD